MSREMEELARALNRFSDKADRLIDRPGETSSRASVSLNAGGVGVWIAATAAIVAVAMNVLLAIGFASRLETAEREVSDLNDYLSAIYMQAPYLKPSKEKGSK